MTNPPAGPPAPVITQRDMLGALQILEKASADPDVLLVLSDEEILALDGIDALTVLGSPHLDQEAVHRETASGTAIRGLIARRMVNPTHEAREEEGDVLIGKGDPSDRLIQLERGLAGILALRRIPEAMVIIDRVSSDLRVKLGLYFFPDGGVLEEFVSTDGFHHFCAPTFDALAQRLPGFVDPHEAAGADGEVEEISVAGVMALEGGLEDTRTLSTVTCVGGGPSRYATVFALSDRVRVVDNGTGDPTQASAGTVLPISDVSRETLGEIIASLLPDPDVPGEDSPGTPDEA